MRWGSAPSRLGPGRCRDGPNPSTRCARAGKKASADGYRFAHCLDAQPRGGAQADQRRTRGHKKPRTRDTTAPRTLSNAGTAPLDRSW
ncbi:MAG: hypothetical protein AMXMBFR23_08430 [Chloroflexota bacterium]